jgi:hypothetical protein
MSFHTLTGTIGFGVLEYKSNRSEPFVLAVQNWSELPTPKYKSNQE